MGGKTKTSFSSNNQPNSRGKSKRTLMLEAMKKNSYFDSNKDMSNEEVEVNFFSHLIFEVENKTDNFSPCLNFLANKGWPSIKPSYDLVEFEFDENGTPAEQAAQILKAVSSGQIPPDIGNNLVNSITQVLKIEEVTEIKQRLEEVMKKLGMN